MITFEETVQSTINLLKRAEIAEMQLAEAKKKVTETEKQVEDLKKQVEELEKQVLKKQPQEVKAVEKPVVREPDILKK